VRVVRSSCQQSLLLCLLFSCLRAALLPPPYYAPRAHLHLHTPPHHVPHHHTYPPHHLLHEKIHTSCWMPTLTVLFLLTISMALHISHCHLTTIFSCYYSVSHLATACWHATGGRRGMYGHAKLFFLLPFSASLLPPPRVHSTACRLPAYVYLHWPPLHASYTHVTPCLPPPLCGWGSEVMDRGTMRRAGREGATRFTPACTCLHLPHAHSTIPGILMMT